MSRKPLGPPPDWIAAEANEPAPGPDPLRSIFNEARAVRTGEFEDDKGVFAMVQERALHLTPEQVATEIKRRLREQKDRRGDFSAVIIAPSFTADVPDVREARLVVLGPGHCHAGTSSDSQARRTAATLLEHRGAGPRAYRNTVVFIAADQARSAELLLAARNSLAWQSLVSDARDLHLDAEQTAQAELGLHRSEVQLARIMGECYRWLLVPLQREASEPVEWREIEVDGQGSLAENACARLEAEGFLYTNLDSDRLRLEVDRLRGPLGEKAPIGQLAEHFARFLFLPRLSTMRVLQDAIQAGLASADTIRVGAPVATTPRPQAVATRTPKPAGRKRRFQAEFGLDPLHFSRDANAVHIAVVQHLLALSAAGVKLTLKVEASLPENAPEDVVSTVTSNCRTLACPNFKLETE